jgi:exopolysaccharide biosynthesis polyprenyl glycosylphosphotransferase
VLLGDILALGVLASLGHLLAGAADGSTPTLLARALQPWWHFDAAALLSLTVTRSYAGWSGSQHRTEVVRASLLATTLSLWGMLPLLRFIPASTVFGLTFTVTASFLLVGRSLSRWTIRTLWQGAGRAPAAVLVGSEEDHCAALSLASAEDDFRVVGYVTRHGEPSSSAFGTLEQLGDIIGSHRIETILIGDSVSDDELRWIEDVSQVAGCELLYPASAVKLAGARAKLVTRYGQPFFELGAPVLHAQQLLVKRLVDVIGAVAGLVLLSPLLALVALVVAVDSRGPIIFSQHRTGLGGRRFRMLKFRTMRASADAEKASLAHLNHTGDPRLFKIPNDPRVTRAGAWLRRWSLDELPQLLNVLRGDMSLVGPRPFFESDLADYDAHHFRRLGAKPGMTGLWQVSGRSDVLDFEEVVRYDRQYIEEWSLRLDLWILLRTMPALCRRSGAY